MMTVHEIDVSTLLTALCNSSTVPILRKLLLQSGLPLAELFVCDNSNSTAVPKNKNELKKSVLYIHQTSVKRTGGKPDDGDSSPSGQQQQQQQQQQRPSRSRLNKVDGNLSPHLKISIALTATMMIVTILTSIYTRSKRTPDKAARLPGVKIVPIPPTSKSKSKRFPTKKFRSTKKRRPTKKRRSTTWAEDLYQRIVAAIGLKDRTNVASVCACLVVALAVAGTIGTIRAGTRKPRTPIQQVLRNYEAILTKQGAFKPDSAAILAKGKKSYEDTGFCLQGIDRRLHRLCKHYVHPDELRYKLLQLTTHRSVFHGRTLLVEHLLRNNGEIRPTCAEMSLAIAHHWRARQLMGIVREKVFRTLRQSSGT